MEDLWITVALLATKRQSFLHAKTEPTLESLGKHAFSLYEQASASHGQACSFLPLHFHETQIYFSLEEGTITLHYV